MEYFINTKKRLLFFINDLRYGGAEKVLVNLVNHLNKNKYDITLLTLFDEGINKQYIKSHINYKYIFKKLFRLNTFCFKLFTKQYLFRKYIKGSYDLLIAFLEGTTTRIISESSGIKTKKIAWIHVEMPNSNILFYPFRSKNECIDSYNKYDRIIAVSNSVKDSFLRNTGINNNIEVQYNPIDSEYIKKRAIETDFDERFDTKTFSLVSVGRLAEQKGYERLLQVHKKLLDEGYHYKLYIIGTGEKKDSLERLINKQNISKSTFLLSFQENPWKYVRNTNLFVCSSYREGYSSAVSEALILGTPVITTLCSGMKEMLGDSEYGLIVENNSQSLYKGIKHLLNDKGLLQHYRAKASERGSMFEIKNTVQAVEDLFDSVLNEK